jgi:hypothetical protein
MALTRLRFLSCLFASLLVNPSRAAAFDTSLSDTAVREAYFLGQRHDESLTRFLDKYAKHLPMPTTGPYVSSVTLFTPYALAVLQSSQHPYGYSAQQAELAHRDRKETVQAFIEIQLTDSYPSMVPDPASRSTNAGWVLRSPDFWSDFQIQFFDKDQRIRTLTSTGHPNYFCSEDGGCILSGATLQFEFLAEDFASDDVSVQIDPPEGESLMLDFDLGSVR